MILHGYFRSSAAFRVRIALNLKALDYTPVAHHLVKGEQHDPAYLKLNPQGLVPVLEDGGHVLTQSLAIIEYLEEVYPEPPLLPAGAADRARVRALAQISAVDIHPINNLRVLKYLRGELGLASDSVDAWYRHWVEKGFQGLEPQLANDSRTGLFCHGDTPGLAEVCLIPQVFNAQRFNVDMTPFPTIARINAAALRLSAFDRACPGNQPDAE